MSEGDNQPESLSRAQGKTELEIIEFAVGKTLYGINVAKVREVLKPDMEIVPVPDAHDIIEGVINLRGKIIPVIQLAKYLNEDVTPDRKRSRIIITELNKALVAFLVSSVTTIHRLFWAAVEPPSAVSRAGQGYAIGVINMGEKMLFLLDFERIARDINPRANADNADGE